MLQSSQRGWRRVHRVWRSTTCRLSSEHRSSNREGRGGGRGGLRALEEKVGHHLRAVCDVQAGTRLLLSVSGGCDSTAMLHIMAAIRKQWEPQLDIEVIHFNHQLREESEEEEAFVSEIARGYGIPLHVRRLDDIHTFSGNFQANAREWRRAESLKVIQAHSKCGLIASAHHMDDQIETLMLKLLRGSHLSHIHAMLPRGPQSFVRPLLTTAKEEILKYMTSRQLEWREDSSNQDDAYKRNAIRAHAVPVLTALAGSRQALYKRVVDLGRQSVQLQGWIRDEVKKYKKKREQVPFCVSGRWCDIFLDDEFYDLPHMVQSEYLLSVINEFAEISSETIPLSFDMMESTIHLLSLPKNDECSGRLSSSISLSKQWLATKVGPVLRLRRSRVNLGCKEVTVKSCRNDGNDDPAIRVSYDPKEFDVDVEISTSTEIRAGNEPDWPKHSNDAVTLTALPVGASLHIRHRRDGDAFLSAPSHHRKQGPLKLSSYMQDLSLPLHARDRIAIVTLNDDVIAVPPFVARNYSEAKSGDMALTLTIRQNCTFLS